MVLVLACNSYVHLLAVFSKRHGNVKPEFSKASSSKVLLILLETRDPKLSWTERQKDKNCYICTAANLSYGSLSHV